MDGADRPTSEEGIGDAAAGHILTALAEGEVIDVAELEVVSLVELADGVFETAVEVVHGLTTDPGGVGVGEDLREDIGAEEGEAGSVTLFELHDEGMVLRVAAAVADAATLSTGDRAGDSRRR